MSNPAPAPAGPSTPRSFRVAEDLWDRALEAAHRRGTTRTAVLVQALEELVAADELERTWRDGLATDQHVSTDH